MCCRPLIVALVVLSGCGGAPSGERPFLTRTYRTADGLTAHYVLFVPPHRDPAEKLPVILFLNGWGENGDDGLRQISNNFGGDMWRMRATFPFLAVCPQCKYNAEWAPGSPNEKLALGVLDEAIREFNGDPDRVTITGASTGGTGAMRIALANPRRFAAVVPIATAIHIAPEDVAGSGLAIWNLYNSGDSTSLVRVARKARRLYFQAGANPLITEFDQAGHNAWDSAYSSPALYRWMLKQRTGANDALVPFQSLTPAESLTLWTAADGSAWSYEGEELIGPGSVSTGALTSPAMIGDWAVHFDVQLAPGLPIAFSLVGEDGTQVELRAPLSRDGLAEMTSGDKPAMGCDPAAQRALRVGWNDVRLQWKAGRFTLLFNGWLAMEDVALPLTTPIRVALRSGSSDQAQRFRYLRVSQQAAGEPRP